MDRRNWNYLALFPDILEELLRGWGFSPEATVLAWRDCGWLTTRGDGRIKVQLRFQGGRAYFYALRRTAVEELESGVGEGRSVR